MKSGSVQVKSVGSNDTWDTQARAQSPGHGPYHYRSHVFAVAETIPDSVTTAKALLPDPSDLGWLPATQEEGQPVSISGRRLALIDDVASRVPASATADCVRVAVDGIDGAGKTVFADELAERLRFATRPVVRVSADDFHHVRAIRYRRVHTMAAGWPRDRQHRSARPDRG